MANKPIDASYLARQFKNFDTQILKNKYNIKFQFATMPTPSVELVGKLYQYLGETNENFTNGYFYKVVQKAETSEYIWETITQAAPEYTIVKKEAPSSDEYSASYTLQKDGVDVGAPIDIPKDFFVADASFGVATAEDVAAGGKLEGKGFEVGDAYIELDVNLKDKSEPKPVYINVSTLVDVYVQGNGISIAANTEGDNEISVVIATNSGLKFTEAKQLSLDFETEEIAFDYSTWDTATV